MARGIGRVKTEAEKKNISKKMMGNNNNPNYKSYYQDAVRVRCVELGCVFDSVNKAAKAIKTTSANITHVLKGRQVTAGGYHWVYEK